MTNALLSAAFKAWADRVLKQQRVVVAVGRVVAKIRMSKVASAWLGLSLLSLILWANLTWLSSLSLIILWASPAFS